MAKPKKEKYPGLRPGERNITSYGGEQIKTVLDDAMLRDRSAKLLTVMDGMREQQTVIAEARRKIGEFKRNQDSLVNAISHGYEERMRFDVNLYANDEANEIRVVDSETGDELMVRPMEEWERQIEMEDGADEE